MTTDSSYLIVADLDGAMLANPQATRRFAHSWHNCSQMIRLVYASRRFSQSIFESVRSHQLPEPDAVIGGAGTEICLFPEGEPLVEWQSRWWSTWALDHVREVLERQLRLTLQPPEFQSEYKRSYFVYDATPHWLQATRRLLKERQLDAELLYSSNRDLDVVPSGASKGAATEFLARRWNIPRSRVVVASDSANAVSMFLFGFRGIITANAQSELRDLCGLNVYRSLLPFPDAILDGLRYWIVDKPADSGQSVRGIRQGARTANR